MIRLQIQLEERDAERLREMAHRDGVSIAALVRDAVARFLERDAPVSRADRVQRILDLAGRYASGCSDVSERHDEYFVDAILGDDVRR